MLQTPGASWKKRQDGKCCPDPDKLGKKRDYGYISISDSGENYKTFF